LPETVTQFELLEEIEKFYQDPKVPDILVQLPLSNHIDETAILKAYSVEKDPDGFSAWHIGNLSLHGGDPPLAVPCAPAGVIELLQRLLEDAVPTSSFILST
jgi:methylenetetrahydrofolate dehydrogenase (NADP+)/methenyltetrahydrofolate cyclohydrolase/formyltetrahydrofolate synthetase